MSAMMLDQRVLNAALAVATSTSRSFDERRSALTVVVALYAPGRALTSHFWDYPANTSLAHVADASQQPGMALITSADRQRVFVALELIAASDPSPERRSVTKALVKELKLALPKS